MSNDLPYAYVISYSACWNFQCAERHISVSMACNNIFLERSTDALLGVEAWQTVMLVRSKFGP